MSFFSKAIAGVALAFAAVSIARKQRPTTELAPIDQVPPRIELDDDFDVTFWMRRLGVSKRKLKAAVKRVGADVDLVRAHLALA